MRIVLVLIGMLLPVLAGAYIGELPTAPVPASVPTSGTAYLSVSQVPLSLGGFNADLATHGYTGFDDRPLAVGGGFTVSAQRLLLNVEGNWQPARHGSGTVDGQPVHTALRGLYGFGNVGAVVAQCSTCKVYPFIGVGVGRLQLSAHRDGPTDYGAVLDNPAQSAHLSRVMVLTQAGLGIDFLLPAAYTPHDASGIVVGVRAGYIYTPEALDRPWRLNGTTLTGGPDPTFDGAYLQVSLGVGWSHMP
jgi:hypothetical protein